MFRANVSNWVDGVTTSVTGVYAMTVHDNGTGPALYIGTGNTGSGSDGDIWKSTNGVTWSRIYHASEYKINILASIDGVLYMGGSRPSGTGRFVRFTNDTWMIESAASRPVKTIEKYGGVIYYTSSNVLHSYDTETALSPTVSTIGGGTEANDVDSMRAFSGRLYASHTHSTIERLANTTDPTTWIYEEITDRPFAQNMRILSDGYMYLALAKLNDAKIWRKTPAGVSESILELGVNSDTGSEYDRTVDVVEFNGRKYVGVVDRFGTSGTNRLGYMFKLTN